MIEFFLTQSITVLWLKMWRATPLLDKRGHVLTKLLLKRQLDFHALHDSDDNFFFSKLENKAEPLPTPTPSIQNVHIVVLGQVSDNLMSGKLFETSKLDVLTKTWAYFDLLSFVPDRTGLLVMY
jgi:hypothetical protein